MDSGASMVRFTEDGTELDFVAISEERLIRKKHPYTFPIFSIGYCMDHYGLESLDEVDLIVSDFIRVKRWHRSGPGYNCSDFDYLKRKFAADPAKIVQISHHMAHAASTFYTSGFDEAAILIVDGNGTDLQTTSFMQADNGKIRYIDTYKAHGIGNVYSKVTSDILGLGPGSEGKTMGLAPYGEQYEPVLTFGGELDGVRTNYANFMRRMPISDVLNQIDPKNRPKNLINDYPRCDHKDNVTQPYFARAAFDVQEETERVMVHLGKELFAATKSPNVCVAGGVALNSVANKIMFDATDFQDISIFPACSDAGIPFGLAIWGYYNAREFAHLPKRKLDFRHAYTGTTYADTRITGVLEKYGIKSRTVSPDDVAAILAEGNVVGWFQGASEYGPRSLGHRSILGDSRREEMKDFINIRVKHRETYRPFAPAILLEDCPEYFDLDVESPFMLLVADCKKPDAIPSVIHVDNTARVQTVTAEDNDRFFDLVSAFKKLTGVPVVLNTSFNDAGEPIVETPEDALVCFLRSDMDLLVLGDQLVERPDNIDGILKSLNTDRDSAIEARRQHLMDWLCPGYSLEERDSYIKRENTQAVWHVTYRAKSRLETQVLDWIKNDTPVHIVGTRDHTTLLRDVINGFDQLRIEGYVDFEGKIDRAELNLDTDTGLAACDWSALESDACQAILVSSFEYMYDIEYALKRRNLDAKAYYIYDNVSRSIIDVMAPGTSLVW